MKFTLNFDMTNAAFEDLPEFEIREILKQVGRQVIFGFVGHSIRDHSGNTIGQWEIDPG